MPTKLQKTFHTKEKNSEKVSWLELILVISHSVTENKINTRWKYKEK